jgi:DNA polymerase
VEALERLSSRIRRCKKCRLWKGRSRAVPGEGPTSARIMIIGQAPGRNEDETGRPFIGRAGKFLDKLLEQAGIRRSDVFITSVVKCFPPKNRIPKKDEIKACNSYLREQIRLVKPKVIVLLGNVAIRAVLGNLKHGKPVRIDDITYLPTYHPAAGMRFPKIRKAMERDFRVFFTRSRAPA